MQSEHQVTLLKNHTAMALGIISTLPSHADFHDWFPFFGLTSLLLLLFVLLLYF